jgi:hypothetical protein
VSTQTQLLNAAGLRTCGSGRKWAYRRLMEPDDRDKLTAWWLDIAPSRQEELLTVPTPAMPWLDESIAAAGLEPATVQQFLEDKRRELEPTRDAGLNPRPNATG